MQIGTNLLKKLEEIVIKNKLEEIQLNKFFPEALKFFTKQGFDEVVKIKNWKYSGLDCYFLRKNLIKIS